MTIPASQTIINIPTPGGPEVLEPIDAPVPVPATGEVLIKIAAAGVNRGDCVQRIGLYPSPPGAPEHMGLEVSGTIAALGDGVANWSEGDEVCALLAGGGYAEYVAVNAAQLLPVPKGVSLIDAAALPEVFCTVWTNVFERGRLAQGETFLVHGGTSGIGTAAVALAHAKGHKVFATAGSTDKCKVISDLGGHAINYNDEDFVEVVRAETGGKGVDVILDMVGGSYIQRNIDTMAEEGRMVSIAFLQGSVAEVNFMRVMLKKLTLTGSTLRARPTDEKGRLIKEVQTHVWPLIEAGKIGPVVDGTFPLRDAAEAHRRIESSSHIGKILLLP